VSTILTRAQHEYQVKHRTRDTWANRETKAGDAQALAAVRQEAYLQKMQANINKKHGVDIKPTIKLEKFEDDYAREGRRLDRVSYAPRGLDYSS
jgi:hypothetical protein